MRDVETSFQQFEEFLLKAQLVKDKAAPYCVASVRRFLVSRLRSSLVHQRLGAPRRDVALGDVGFPEAIQIAFFPEVIGQPWARRNAASSSAVSASTLASAAPPTAVSASAALATSAS